MIVKTGMAAAATLVLCATLASGHGFFRGDPGPGGPLGPRGPRGGGLLQELVFPCRVGCFDSARTCDDAARAAAVACGEQTCDSQIQAARSACQADLTSEACGTARTALLSCLAPCLASGQTDFSSCRTTLDSCLTGCGES